MELRFIPGMPCYVAVQAVAEHPSDPLHAGPDLAGAGGMW